jgi:phosphomevalonate kinase
MNVQIKELQGCQKDRWLFEKSVKKELDDIADDVHDIENDIEKAKNLESEMNQNFKSMKDTLEFL